MDILDFSESSFQNINEFKECMRYGGEVEFEWKGVHYGVVRYGKDQKITIYEAYKPESEKVCETADDALDYMLGTDRFRDVLSQVTILFRSV